MKSTQQIEKLKDIPKHNKEYIKNPQIVTKLMMKDNS